MEALVVSTSIVALAEMGDKTQLLSFVLAAKLKGRVPIVLGILVATLANHFLAGWIGAWLATLVSPAVLRWTIAASFRRSSIHGVIVVPGQTALTRIPSLTWSRAMAFVRPTTANFVVT